MEHTVWLSRADVCALQRAELLLELLETHLPRGDVKTVAAQILTLQTFRDSIRRACFESWEARDHVRVQVSDDTLAVLEAMGLCGARDKRGQRICIAWPQFMQGSSNKETKASLYDVLVKQYGILFGLEPRGVATWSETSAQLLLGNKSWVSELQNQLSKLMRFARNGDAQNFRDSACQLQTMLQKSIAWRLRQATQPEQLLHEFRENAHCPQSADAKKRKGAVSSEECERVVGEHTRLFSARLTESVVMQALSFLLPAERDRLQRSLRSMPKPNDKCDFDKMRVSWPNKDGNITYAGNFDDLRRDGAKKLTGLDAYSKWHNGQTIQDSLTRKTKELSRLSDNTLRRKVSHVLSEVVLNLDKQETNAEFDAAYNMSVKAPKETDKCTEVPDRSATLLALAEHWSKQNTYPSFFDSMLRDPSVTVVDACEEKDLLTKLQELVQKINSWALDLSHDTSQFTRSIWLRIENDWYLPLTQDASESTGLFRLVVWMICHQKVPRGSTELFCQITNKGKIEYQVTHPLG